MRVFDYKVQLISHAPRDTTTTQHVREEFRDELADRSAQGTASALPSQVRAQGGGDTPPALAVHPLPRAGRIYLRHLGIARRHIPQRAVRWTAGRRAFHGSRVRAPCGAAAKNSEI